MPTFSDLSRAAYCPRQLYYARTDEDRGPPAEAIARKELAFRYDELRTADDETLAELPIDCSPADYRAALEELSTRSEWDQLCEPSEQEYGVEGKDCHGRIHKLLAGDPPIEYLEESEAPAYVLTNQKRGIGLGTKRTTTEPDSDRGTVCLVTGRRTLCLVGQDPKDEVFSIPHESVAAVSAHTGLLANRIELRTPRKAYHCWVGRRVDGSLLEAIVEYVRARMHEEPEEIDRADGASRFTYRGSAVEGTSTDRTETATASEETTTASED